MLKVEIMIVDKSLCKKWWVYRVGEARNEAPGREEQNTLFRILMVRAVVFVIKYAASFIPLLHE
jgi:hypothetical protein